LPIKRPPPSLALIQSRHWQTRCTVVPHGWSTLSRKQETPTSRSSGVGSSPNGVWAKVDIRVHIGTREAKGIHQLSVYRRMLRQHQDGLVRECPAPSTQKATGASPCCCFSLVPSTPLDPTQDFEAYAHRRPDTRTSIDRPRWME